MKIIHIVGDSKFGGGSVIISQLVIDQHLAGNDVSVLSTDPEFSAFLTSHNIKVVPLDCIWRSYNLFADIYGILKLAKYLRKEKFDVVHTHTTKAGFVGRVAAWMAKVKYIVHTVHGFPFSEVSSKLKINVFTFLESLLFSISTKVVFVSNYHLNWARELNIVKGSGDVAVAIRNGVEPVEAQCLDTSDELLPRVIFIGRMVREKGIFDLLAAYQNLQKNGLSLKLVFIGDGPDLAALKAAAENDVSVGFTGFVTNVPSLVCKDDVFVLPSYREGLSISAIEAQSMGLPSILSDVGGNVEVSDNGNAALTYKVSDTVDLTDKLMMVLSDKMLRDKLKSSASVNFNNNFTSFRMLNEYKKLYSEFN